MSENRENEFPRSLHSALRESEEHLDDISLARLRAARARAIEQVDNSRGARWFIPFSAAAAVMLVLVAVLNVQVSNKDIESADIAVLEDLEMLVTQESLEFLQDLEFYEWLDGQVDKAV